MKYVAIDIETTGLDPETCQILELAMVVENTSGHEPLPPVEELPTFHRIFNHTIIIGDPFALHMNASLLDKISKGEGVDLNDGWRDVRRFLAQHFPIDKAVPAGKNVQGFDLQFFPTYTRELFTHRAIDPGSVFVDFGKDRPPGMRDLIEPEAEHTALGDARDVVRILRRKYYSNNT